MKGEKPMQRALVWKLFEQLMDKKFEQDSEDMSVGMQPRPMPQFVIDYMIEQEGVKSSANKVLSQLVLSLAELYKEKHQYGTLFCRLVQVSHPDPIDNILAAFIVKVRKEFNALIEEYVQRKAAMDKKAKQEPT